MGKYLEMGIGVALILCILGIVGYIAAMMYFAFGMVGTWIMFGIVSIFYFWASIGALKARKRLRDTLENFDTQFTGATK